MEGKIYLPAFVYKITCNDPEIRESYIGSTYNFRSRLNAHKTSCENPKSSKYNYKLYKFIRNNGGWGNFTMKVLYGIEVFDKMELLELEKKTINIIKPSLNCQVPLRTRSEYYQDNKQKILDDVRSYREKNKDMLATQTKCLCGGTYTYVSRYSHFKTLKHNKFIEINNKNLKDIKHYDNI